MKLKLYHFSFTSKIIRHHRAEPSHLRATATELPPLSHRYRAEPIFWHFDFFYFFTFSQFFRLSEFFPYWIDLNSPHLFDFKSSQYRLTKTNMTQKKTYKFIYARLIVRHNHYPINQFRHIKRHLEGYRVKVNRSNHL